MARIMTASFIAPIVFMVLPRPVQGLGVFRAFRKLGSRLLKPKSVPVRDLFFSAFFCPGKGLMAPRIKNFYFHREIIFGGSGCPGWI